MHRLCWHRDFAIGFVVLGFVGFVRETQAQSYSQTNTPVGATPKGISLGDFNLDGKLDCVTANSQVNFGTFLAGNGAGGFAASNIAVGASGFQAVACGHFDGDDRLDLVFASSSLKQLSIVLNSAVGFSSPTTINLNSLNLSPEKVSVSDLNGDGKCDVALVSKNSNNMAVLLGNGNGTFGAPSAFATNQTPSDLALGDLNGDGKMDAVVATATPQSVSILLGNGSGGFGPKTDVNSGTRPSNVALGDLDGDGDLDIVVSNSVNNQIATLLGNGNGSFGAPTIYGSGGVSPSGLRVGDINRNGIADVVVTNKTNAVVAIFLGSGTGSLQAPLQVTLGSVAPEGLEIGDANSDGKQDILVVNSGTSNVTNMQNNVATDSNLTIFGVGTPGCFGSPVMTGNKKPQINTPDFVVTCTNAPQNSLGLCLIGDAKDAVGSDPFSVGVLFHVDFVNSVTVVGGDFHVDAAGTASIALVIPNNPALHGTNYYFQGLFVEPAGGNCTASPYGLTSSKGLAVHIP